MTTTVQTGTISAKNGNPGQLIPASGGGDNILDNPSAVQGKFETDLFPFLKARIAAIVHESEFEPDDNSPVTIIDANEAWYVDVAWKLEGRVVPMICGKWHVRLFLENIGADGDDLNRDSDRGLIDLNPCGDGYYRARISVPANAVQVGNGSTPYKAVVGVTYLTNCPIKGGGYRPGPMAGFVELPTMQFFNEGVEI